ncbi:MAG TPA: GatB/YqeY domain-containing protein [Candidatus Saccharimonadia bacterium]
MTLQERLTEDMKSSMKAGTADRTGVLRLVRGAIKNEEIKVGHPLGDDEVLKVLAREVKQRKDSIEAYTAAGRSELAEAEAAEQKIIAEYLPQAMDETELRQLIDAVVAQVGATDMKQMGVVIGQVMQQVGTRADGGTVSKLVRERLAGGAA